MVTLVSDILVQVYKLYSIPLIKFLLRSHFVLLLYFRDQIG